MFVVQNYTLAIIFCIITMLCWGSWANTLKLASEKWRYELYYWDTVIGSLLFSIILAFTAGSIGEQGRPFVEDILQAKAILIGSVLLGALLCNGANILLSSSVSLVGLSVAFPLGLGVALVFGVTINYIGVPKGNPILLFSGLALISIALFFNFWAAAKTKKKNDSKSTKKKGIILALVAGVCMSFFYRFVAIAMDLDHFDRPASGTLTPYTALFVFCVGIFISNLLFNTLIMKYPFIGTPTSYKEYFHTKPSMHLIGMSGGAIWRLGTSCSYLASGKAGPAIAYAIGQGAPMVAAIWGVFVWKEFKGAPKFANYLLGIMFLLFVSGLLLIVLSGEK